MKKKEYSIEIGGEKLTATFSDLAEQANGSVLMRLGDTVILATAVMSKNQRDGLDYFPLSVDYEERFYASGQILGSRFMRREGRPTDEAVLSGRIVDRTIRPLFEHHIRNEVQVVVTVLSLGQYDPDIFYLHDSPPEVCALGQPDSVRVPLDLQPTGRSPFVAPRRFFFKLCCR